MNAVSVVRARRTEILDAAATLFASSGFRTSLKEIADACGILPGSLYHHFESKEALIVELVERYHADLDTLAEEAVEALQRPDAEPFQERLVTLGTAIADCAVRHRAALLLTLYEPPSGAGDELVRVTRRSPLGIERAMFETLRFGACQWPPSGRHRSRDPGRPPVSGAAARQSGRIWRRRRRGPGLRYPLRSRLERDRRRSAAHTVRWIGRGLTRRRRKRSSRGREQEEDEDERLPMLRAVARSEFGRRGYEATTVRDIASAAGFSVGSVYRLIGSKDELLGSIMRSFTVKARSGWSNVLRSDGTAVEKLDALMWININAVMRFSDEYNIQLAWIRESPPNTTNLGSSFSARLGDLKSLLAQGVRSGELRVEGPSANIRAWSLFELLWMPENIVGKLGADGALDPGT